MVQHEKNTTIQGLQEGMTARLTSAIKSLW